LDGVGLETVSALADARLAESAADAEGAGSTDFEAPLSQPRVNSTAQIQRHFIEALP
jgi:hypothetical protein